MAKAAGRNSVIMALDIEERGIETHCIAAASNSI